MSTTENESQNLPLRAIFEAIAVTLGACAACAAAYTGSTKPALIMGMAFGTAYILKR